MKKLLLLALLFVLALTGCHTTEPLIITQREYVAVGVPTHLTRTEQIAPLSLTREEYVAAKPKEREEALATYSRTLISTIHLLNGRLTDIAALVVKQKTLVAEQNEIAKKEAEDEKARK